MRAVYSVEDLSDPTLKGELADARLAVIGYPIKHSASPQMHQAALDAAGEKIRYIRIEVLPGEVKKAFSLMEQQGFIGCNVTVPHKLEAMELCDALTDEAKGLGATNTILFQEGRRIGHNTDGPGLANAIVEDFGKPLSEMKVLILGAGGGAGRAIATQCAKEGARAIYLSNRTVEKLEPIAELLRSDFAAHNVHILSNAERDLENAVESVDLVINATSLGLKEGDLMPLPSSALHASLKVFDAIYNPPQTELLKQASAVGANVSNGLSMLLHQGALSYAFWLGKEPQLDAMKNALQEAVYGTTR